MLDTSQHDPKQSADWRDHLSWGDIVSFRFPVFDRPEPGQTAKKRPCLIIDRCLIGALTFVTLAYGTSQIMRKQAAFEISVSSLSSVSASGLHQPTRFQCSRRVRVSLNFGGFVAHPITQSPVIGTLPKNEFAAMNAVRARIQAVADIAADRRVRRRFYGSRPAKTHSTDNCNLPAKRTCKP